MALMGRSLGIPSRVAVGFLRPDQVGKDTYVYSSHDLHAWPEMYFGGTGWVRFEPTPQGRAREVPPYTTQQVPQANPSQSSSVPSAAPTLNRIDRSTDPNAGFGKTKSRSPLASPVLVGFVLGVLLAVLLALVPRMLRSLRRRRRWSAAGTDAGALVEAGWAEIRDSAVDLGVGFDDHVSLRTAGRELVRSFGRPGDEDDALGRATHRGPDADPEATAALNRMVGLVERARYARSLPSDAARQEQVRADVASCVAALRAGAGKRRRSRATWLPASLTRTGAAGRSRSRRGTVLEPGVDRAV
jgi:hypothetical protein